MAKSQVLHIKREKHTEVSSRQEERAGFPNTGFVRQLKSLAFFVAFSPR